MNLKRKSLQPPSLPNIGQSCFLNSSLQALWNSELIKRFIISSKKSDICRTICDIMESKGSNAQSLYKQLDKYIKLGEEFDANEFILTLFETIIKETQVKCSNKDYDWCKEFSNIIPIIYGNHINKIECINCNHTVSNNSNFNMIPLFPSSDSSRLVEMLRDFARNELLDNWKCDKCNYDNKNITRTSFISKWPEVLIFVINNYSRSKTVVEINKTLVLDKKEYVLKSVICHMGNMNSGHYNAIIIQKGIWYLCDDDTIVKIDEPDVYKSNSPYVIFYENKVLPK